MTTESPEYYRERYKQRMEARKTQEPPLTHCPYCGKPAKKPHQKCLTKVHKLQNRYNKDRLCNLCQYEKHCKSILFDGKLSNGKEKRNVMCESPEALCRVYKAHKRNGTVADCWYWTEGGEMHFKPLMPNEGKPHKLAVPCCEKCRAAMESAEAAGLLGVEV